MKHKVIIFNESAYSKSLKEQVRNWLLESPSVNVVSAETLPETLFTYSKITIIYNYGVTK